ncbi:MAG: DMT family transporter [Boseongicola sp. SB0676_bin_33]|uniref:DMT family transporter n=1 Tax=Boseongicola sp. SB0664_bin_43 TaxID=2604844 RepID=A0A6B0Y0Q9_9RHOB|nr:DMT family transporter [Boseongicola sp. SB0664_bin_43]MYF89726.1 DMT family transporter [Boseongicola sp. SB0676_bin_33]MYK31366.1 DMT family transporter [Boseongicola sp. SB0670_bin_30]
MTSQSNRNGILVMIATTFVFAAQDGISQHLAVTYNTFMVVMIRYWFFAAFVIAIASRRPGGVRATATTSQPALQILRGLLLAGEICVAVFGFTLLGLVESHAIFAMYPLIVIALAGPLLGERAGWRRWLAVLAGFLGMLIILQPGTGVFRAVAVIPFISAFMFALYSLATRYAARRDNAATSFFWTGVVGAVAMTFAGLPNWEWMKPGDWLWMLALCTTGVFGHWLLIRCYELAEAGAVQPFAYFHQVFAALIGIVVFNEALKANVALGAMVILAAGVFALWRAYVRKRDD